MALQSLPLNAVAGCPLHSDKDHERPIYTNEDPASAGEAVARLPSQGPGPAVS